MSDKQQRADNTSAPDCSALPCPFCGMTGKDNVGPDMAFVPAVTMHNYPGGFRLECEGCGCCGPFHHTGAQAIEAWNRRPNTRDVGPKPAAGAGTHKSLVGGKS